MQTMQTMHTMQTVRNVKSVSLPLATKAGLSACASCSSQHVCLPGLFSDVGPEGSDSLVVGRRRVARHASLFREGDRLDNLFAVRFGQFKSIRRDPSGVLRVAQFYVSGDMIGLDAIADGRHNFRLTALENSEVCEISYAAITKKMANEPKFQQHFLQSMSNAVNDGHNHSAVLSRPLLDERFASFLLSIGDKYERLGYSNKSFRLSMTRGDIGSYLGTTVESVSRLIARFNAQYPVSIVGRTVQLKDRDFFVALLARGQQ